MNDSELRRKVCEGMEAGTLPRARPRRMWGGHGTGATCVVCGEPAKPSQMELELEFDLDTQACGTAGNPHVHPKCFVAWECELSCAELADAASEQTADAQATAHGPAKNGSHALSDQTRERTMSRDGEEANRGWPP
jgi:hypothetical protein